MRCRDGFCGADDCTRCRPELNAWVEDYEKADREREERLHARAPVFVTPERVVESGHEQKLPETS